MSKQRNILCHLSCGCPVS